jgi:hypothetical protein
VQVNWSDHPINNWGFDNHSDNHSDNYRRLKDHQLPRLVGDLGRRDQRQPARRRTAG